MSSYTTALNLLIMTVIYFGGSYAAVYISDPDEGLGLLIYLISLIGYFLLAIFGAPYAPGDPFVALVPLFLFWEFAEWFPVEVSVVLVVFTLLLGLVARERGLTI